MSNLWSDEEVSILIKEYPSKGALGCVPLFIGRSYGAIKAKASKLKILYHESPTKQKTHSQYEHELLDKEIDYIPLETYINANTAILHECIEGHQWKVRPNTIIQGYGCPECAGLKKLTTEQYESRIPKYIKLLEPYINNNTPILHKHITCGKEWYAPPNRIINGHGCPSCNISGIKNQPTILYHVKVKNLYKIGVTLKSDVKQRFGGEWSSLNMELLWEIHFSSGIVAYKLEQTLLRSYKHIAINSGILKSGNTETILEEIPCPV